MRNLAPPLALATLLLHLSLWSGGPAPAFAADGALARGFDNLVRKVLRLPTTMTKPDCAWHEAMSKLIADAEADFRQTPTQKAWADVSAQWRAVNQTWDFRD